MTPAVAVNGIRYNYGKTPALLDVSFTVPPRTICGLIGENGAGKTTTLRILATDLAPTWGRVELFGRDAIEEYVDLRPRLGFMTDSPDLYEDMSLLPYLEMFAALYGIRKRREAADIAIELAGLRAFRKRRLSNLSKGEAQRVALARTLVHDPELLVLDEPADGLDPRGRVELRELLLLLQERGKTIVVSSHILADLEMICDHLVFLQAGRVIFQGSREEIRKRGLERERIRIELCGAMDGRCRSILAGESDIQVTHETATTVEVELPGGEERAADILAKLVHAGVRVSAYHRRSVSLEDLFLRITEKAP